jgi:hypothetical protein
MTVSAIRSGESALNAQAADTSDRGAGACPTLRRLETLPVVIRKRGERASRYFIEPPTFATPTPRKAYYHAPVTCLPKR